MRFRPIKRYTALAAIPLVLAGCGLFGNKNDPNSILTYQTPNGGCLDNIGTQVAQFANGTISESDLNAGWNCASGSLTLFTQFIRGSVPNGYTTQDIQVFISHFLFTKAPISMSLVQSVFALKASLFGGSADILTVDEINQVLPFISVLQSESGRLLPLLRSRVQNPTPANLLRLARAISSAGRNIAGALKTSGNASLSADLIQTLINETQAITDPTATPNSQAAQLVVSLKQLLAGGSDSEIEAAAWPTLIQSLAGYLGPALSALSYSSSFAKGSNAQDGFFTKLVGDITDALNATIQLNGGSIPFTTVSNVIQYIPDSLLNSAQRTAVSNAQGMLFTHLLHSGTANAIDRNVSSYLNQQVKFWDQAQSVINTIYDQNGFDPDAGATAAQLTTALKPYSSNAEDQAQYQWITALIQNYAPYFVDNDNEITLPATSNYSLHDMSMKHLIRLISSVMLSGYSTATDQSEIDQADFTTLVNDLTPVLAAWQMTDLAIPNPAQARFLQASLFMPSSRGATTLNLDEGSQYILYFLSIYDQALRVEAAINPQCPSYGTDAYGTPLMNAACFRKNYFANYESFWNRMPLMTSYFQKLSSTDQDNLEVALETASRYYGYTDQCVGMYDTQGFGAMLHYIETVMERFDLEGSGILDTTDALNAFPVFQNELITVGASSGLSSTDVGEQQAAFTYALAKGALPKSGFVGEIDFLWWWLIVGQNGWNVQAARDQLYQVMAGISPPPVPPATTQCP